MHKIKRETFLLLKINTELSKHLKNNLHNEKSSVQPGLGTPWFGERYFWVKRLGLKAVPDSKTDETWGRAIASSSFVRHLMTSQSNTTTGRWSVTHIWGSWATATLSSLLSAWSSRHVTRTPSAFSHNPMRRRWNMTAAAWLVSRTASRPPWLRTRTCWIHWLKRSDIYKAEISARRGESMKIQASEDVSFWTSDFPRHEVRCSAWRRRDQGACGLFHCHY